MKIKPIGNRVLIKPKKIEEKTAGGIYIPDSAKEKTNEAEVIEVGDGKEITVKPGDTIIYESYAGTEVNSEKEKMIIIQSKDIIAKVE